MGSGFFIHKNILVAKNIFVLIAVIIIYFTIIFPFFLNVHVGYNHNYKKLFVFFRLFKIPIFRFYIENLNEGFAIHLTKRKAFIIKYSKVLGLGKKIKPLRDYHIVKINSFLKMGYNDNAMQVTSSAFILSFINNIVFKIIHRLKPYVNIKNDIYIFEKEELFELYAEFLIIFNLLMVLISLIKILLGRIYYAITSRKQQNKQCY